MSNIGINVSGPDPIVPEDITNRPRKLGEMALDACYFSRSLTDMLEFLSSYTDLGHDRIKENCQELRANIRQYIRWLRAIFGVMTLNLERYNSSQNLLPSHTFILASKNNFRNLHHMLEETLEKRLRKSYRVFVAKTFNPKGAINPLLMSVRPHTEILAECVLITLLGRERKPAFQAIKALSQPSFPDIRGHQPGATLMTLLQNWERQQSLECDSTKRIGIPKCFSVIWTGKCFVTGSTCPTWGALSELILSMGESSQILHEWYREKRQDQLSGPERAFINKYITRLHRRYSEAYSKMHASYPNNMQYYSKDERPYFQGFYNAANARFTPAKANAKSAKQKYEDAEEQMAKQGREATVAEKRNLGQLSSAFKGADKLLDEARELMVNMETSKSKDQVILKFKEKCQEFTLKRLDKEKESLLQPRLRQHYLGPQSCPQFGQAYQGGDFERKRKCIFCACLYPFKTFDNDLAPNWKTVAELDVGKDPTNPRGCCAEAISFILAMSAAGIFKGACADYNINTK